MNNIIYLKDIRNNRYRKMNKKELLAEMITYQQRRSKQGYDTPMQLRDGIMLFTELNKRATTAALKSLVSAYLNHLQLELKDMGKEY